MFRRKRFSDIMAHASEFSESEVHLKKNLRVIDLIALAIAAIIGGGIFSTIGTAANDGGPAVSLLFVFTALACSFSALCYAEFASRIPLSGSAYTYAYASMGELVAWIIGWDLLMEYSVGNIAVAISWSEYFTGFIHGFGLHIPEYLAMNVATAREGFNEVIGLMAKGTLIQDIPQRAMYGYNAWINAPTLFDYKIIMNIPAFMIVSFVTFLVYIGIKESKNASNLMVLLKLIVILMVIAVGAFYINTDNWTPFAPNGFVGVMKGVSAVFFAYIGFDAISTTAEECKNPQRDLPKAMIWSLIICTILYVLIALVMTGMVSYQQLAVADPLAYIFKVVHLDWFSGLVAFSAIIAMASVLLVFQVGQPRIWMSMSRDGLLPKRFAKIHPKYKTPSYSTLVTGLVVGVPSLFMNLEAVTDLTSIGTLFAFVIICLGVLSYGNESSEQRPKFKVYYINGKYIIPALSVLLFALVNYLKPTFVKDVFTNFYNNIPLTMFLILLVVISVFAFIKRLSLIPTLGLIINLYLMSELTVVNWLRFGIWLIVGLVIYFLYSYKHSKLRNIV